MEIYIKPKKSVRLVKQKTVRLGDIAELYTEQKTADKMKALIIMEISEDIRKNYSVSIMDIIRILDKKFPGNIISNMGEAEVLIEYHSKPDKTGVSARMANFLKTALVFAILFIGSATSIMTFHSDAQVPKILENFYYIFMGTQKTNPMLVTIPYSIGLALGIIVFFNHFSKLRMSIDPTPIKVELTTYKNETRQSILDELEQNKQ